MPREASAEASGTPKKRGNYRFKVVSISGNVVTLENIKSKDRYTTDNYTLDNHLDMITAPRAILHKGHQ